MELGLKGKTVMVAASSQGLGFAIAEAAAEEGANLSIGSRREEAISTAADKLRATHGVVALACPLDVRSADSISSWTERTLAEFGGIDALIVNAGGPKAGGFFDFDDAGWQEAFELTLLSAVRLIRSVLPAMKKAKQGSILTITSSSVKEPIDILLLSNVMRAGVAALAKSLSRELAGDGIRVNNIIPGRIDTERVRSLDEIHAGKENISVEEFKRRQAEVIPLGRYGTPDEFGRTAVFLLSDAAGYITGANFVVDGGLLRCS